MFGKQIDLIKLIPHFILDYWYLLLIYFVFLWALLKSYEIINTRQIPKLKKINIKNISIHFLILISFCSYVVLGIRGGFQKIPIVLLDAAKYTRPNFIPILLNTPFSILKSTELHELKTSNLIPKNLSEKYFSPIHEVKSGKFENLNVCVIILERFSKEFCGIGGRKSYTPFLDSLMEKSLVFTNAYSNGKSSIEGVPAILASLPSLMQDPYINSAYSNNTIQTLPNLLKAKGYHTSFFHGGTNGTMNFDSFAKIAGFDYYYGRTEYNNERDYDGQWGIWDDAFLAQMPKIVSQFKEPFFTSLFTLSSHNPYLVPYKFKGKFPKGNLEIIETIGYTDYSLKLFFNEAKKEKWFNNTLFVITSDHTAISNDKYYSNPIGQYSIPIVFYKNNELIGTNGKTVQQIDILPTIMDYLNYDKPYYAFGESMFSARNKPIIYFTNPYYYLILDSTVYIGIEGRLT
ncbi:MAG: LTA synthase family protein [Sphingobacteriaceae bacterium]|nr:LTA synthase family protein [Sphingobacteriaceae bacterium]